MLVGIHNDRLGRFNDFNLKYESILEHNKIDHIRMDISNADFWEKVKKLDLFIFRWNVAEDLKQIARTIMPVIENYLGIKCFPDLATSWHYDDKIREFYLLKNLGYPIIDSYIFWNRIKAYEWAEGAEYPAVFKLRGGAASHNVLLVKNKSMARRLIKKMFTAGFSENKVNIRGATSWKDFSFTKYLRNRAKQTIKKWKGEDPTLWWGREKNYIMFQKFLPGNKFDTRVVIVGNRAYAFRRHNRNNDWRASGSHKEDIDMKYIDMEFIKIAFRITKELKFQSMAYDFLYDENKMPAICEISYIYPDYPSFCNGFWDDNLTFHKGSYWPQYFHLVDSLNMPELKQPNIKPYI